MKNPNFDILTRPKAIPALSLELAVTSTEAITKYNRLIGSKDPRWSNRARQLFKKRVLNLSDDLRENKRQKCFATGLSFDGGGEFKVLFVDPDISTFELHTAIRKNFEPAMKAHLDDPWRWTLTGLSEDLEKRTLHALSSLTVLSQWKPPRYGDRKARPENQAGALKISIHSGQSIETARQICEEGVALAQANNLARTLAVRPSNDLNPETYQAEIEKRARQRKYKTRFLDRKALTKLGAGGFLAVSQASLEDSGGILQLLSAPRKGRPKIILVGKGICFDTGGYNIKTGAYMNGMHGDMLGSAIALALFETILDLRWDIEVQAYLALAENLISHKAFRPNDVVTALDGTTIEVVDTDAEGRMVLCDTLALARKENPDLILDFATLTGSAIRALDTKRAAVFSNRTDLAQLAYQAGEYSGERSWPFPVGEDYREQLKSDIADISQCITGPNADHIYAATFLSHFVGDTPWIHLDLSPAANKGGVGLVSSDSTGFGVRWGLEVIKRFISHEI